MPPRTYCLITPCRDEARYAERTLASVVGQSERPTLWVIVDDGSSDDTPSILERYAARYDWITIIRRDDRGDRKLGGGVIDAFYTGFDSINATDYAYICKLDLDLHLPPTYFAQLMDRMEANPRLGNVSGQAYFLKAGTDSGEPSFPLKGDELVSEKFGSENACGPSKFYRTECFLEIGGFVRELMWDGIDGHRCRQLGWIAACSDNPELRFIHLRPMGTSHKNWWTGRVRHGFGQYYMGTGPVYMIASAIYRMSRPPLVMGGLAMLFGYFDSMLRMRPRYGDEEFRRFLRKYHRATLIRGKAAATRDLNERQSRIWGRKRVRKEDVAR